MIIFSNKPGQLGNLLFIYANLLAYGIENNIRVSNPAFHSYQAYFEGTKATPAFFSRLGYKLSFFVARSLDKISIKLPFVSVRSLDWDETMNLDLQNHHLRKPLCFLQGWLYRAPQLTQKHQAAIRTFFSPVSKYTILIDQYFKEKFDAANELIIAVHIRRGDYKTFENGRYFYDVEQYCHVMKKAADLFPDHKVHFMVCSNESVNFDNTFTKGLKVTKAPGHELMDMHSMARSNYIIGPPSTYSMWASVYGNVPLYKITEPDRDFTLSDFSIHPSF